MPTCRSPEQRPSDRDGESIGLPRPAYDAASKREATAERKTLPIRRAIGLAGSAALHLVFGFLVIQHWAPVTPNVPPPLPEPVIVKMMPLPPSPPEQEQQPTPAKPRNLADLPSPPRPSDPTIESIIQLDEFDRLPLASSVHVPIRLDVRAQDSVPPPPSNELDGEPTFEGLLLARLEQFRRYPRKALRQRQEGVVHIRFHMNREGRVVEAAIVQGSGCASLDREALATLRRAQPLPKIPDDRPSPLEVTVPIEFVLARTTETLAEAGPSVAPATLSGRY